MQKHQKIIGVIVGGLILLSLIYTFYSRKLQQSRGITSQQDQLAQSIYRSKNLGFSIIIPSYFKVKDELTYVDFISIDEKITVSRIATNFENIQTYINDFDAKRSIAVAEEKTLKIDGYEGLERIEKFSGGPVSEEKVYMVYINGWVYSLSTSARSLYDKLDQIVKTFKYIP